MQRNLLPLLMLFAVGFVALAAPAAASDLQEQMRAEYAGQVLTLRRFYEGDHLHFLSDGSLRGAAAVGPWTLDSRIEVNEIRVRNDVLEIIGRRVQLVFDGKQQTGHSAAAVDELTMLGGMSGGDRKKMEKFLRKLQVEIEIELPSADPNESGIRSAIHAVFFGPGESMVDALPTYWRKYLADPEGDTYKTPVLKEPVYARVGKGVSPPRAISAPDPVYSDVARKARYQGTLVLWLVVDHTGTPRDIRIERPLGLGLDENAVDAVSTWKFKPALKDGEPIAVQINVEVTFRLY
ncbi:MAG: energy transducer TonB [Terriglobales bacterium]